jgi:uncharacterized membrane protein YjjB (DUF3815 family)
MTVDLLHLLHQALFGAIAASGFGILFNFSWRDIPWCAASGALALATRTLGQDAGWSLEAAAFAAAAAVGFAARLLHAHLGIGGNDLAAAGCIPMVPGALAAQGIFGLYAVTVPAPINAAATLVTAMEAILRVLFTMAAIGTGLAVTTLLLVRPARTSISAIERPELPKLRLKE